jgi:acyl-CoA synthetase (AMP-forming)/AMP-acid ligase II
MFIEALYDGKMCWLNTDDIIDVFDDSGFYVKAYTLDENRDGYLISKKTWMYYLGLSSVEAVMKEEPPIAENKVTMELL